MRGPRRQAVVTQGLVVCTRGSRRASNNVLGVSQSQEQDSTACSDHEDAVPSESQTHKATQWGLHNRMSRLGEGSDGEWFRVSRAEGGWGDGRWGWDYF